MYPLLAFLVAGRGEELSPRGVCFEGAVKPCRLPERNTRAASDVAMASLGFVQTCNARDKCCCQGAVAHGHLQSASLPIRLAARLCASGHVCLALFCFQRSGIQSLQLHCKGQQCQHDLMIAISQKQACRCHLWHVAGPCIAHCLFTRFFIGRHNFFFFGYEDASFALLVFMSTADDVVLNCLRVP